MVGAALTSQLSAWHVVGVSLSLVHEDVSFTVWPVLYVGWHVDPEAKVPVRSPTPPLVGAALAPQLIAWHVAGVSVPVVHEDVPLTV